MQGPGAREARVTITGSGVDARHRTLGLHGAHRHPIQPSVCATQELGVTLPVYAAPVFGHGLTRVSCSLYRIILGGRQEFTVIFGNSGQLVRG